MKPVDFRNATFDEIKTRICGQREYVLQCWRAHGPGTTKEVSERSGMSILSFRPRSTELEQLGFICLTPDQPSATEGRYRARTTAEHLAWIKAQRDLANRPPAQPELAL